MSPLLPGLSGLAPTTYVTLATVLAEGEGSDDVVTHGVEEGVALRASADAVGPANASAPVRATAPRAPAARVEVLHGVVSLGRNGLHR